MSRAGLLLLAALAAQVAISPRATVRLPDGGYISVGPSALSDGGIPDGSVVLDNLSATSCFCSTGAGIAVVPNPDGGAVMPAPRGVTLSACTGAACVQKPCTALFIGPPGYDETWAGTGCPVQ